jgi:lysophospholipase L1-like esterase
VKVSRKYVCGMELALLAVSLAVGFLLTEFAIRYLPLGDKMGWSMVPSLSERVAKTGVAKPGKARILVLGDSMTEWRDNTGESYVRVAERMLSSIEVVNLAEGGTDLPSYLSNLLRFGERLRPDLILIGLYLGNDLFPSTPPLASVDIRSALEALPSPSQEPTLRRIAKRSVLINYVFRLGKMYIPALRSGSLEQTIRHLQTKTGLDDAYVARRLSEADPTLVDAARADAINGWDLAFAIFDPDYYGDLAAADSSTPKGKEVEAALGDLRTLIIAARAQNAKAAVVLLPPPVWVAERYRFYFKRLGYRELGPLSGPVPLVERVKAYLSAEGVPALDVLPALRADAEATYLENDIHLNRRGHDVVGRELASFLVDKGFVFVDGKLSTKP